MNTIEKRSNKLVVAASILFFAVIAAGSGLHGHSNVPAVHSSSSGLHIAPGLNAQDLILANAQK